MLNSAKDWLKGIRRAQEAQTPSVAFMIEIDKLPVGSLEYKDRVWIFRYTKEFQAQDKYKPITDFPDVNKEYRQEELWPFFALRIPSLEQVLVREFLRDHRNQADEVTLLREFGRESVANPFKLVESK